MNVPKCQYTHIKHTFVDQVQTYRITGRQLIPSIRQLTYYYNYLYGSADIPEEWDEEE